MDWWDDEYDGPKNVESSDNDDDNDDDDDDCDLTIVYFLAVRCSLRWNLEWMLRQLSWSLHMSLQVWQVGAYDEQKGSRFWSQNDGLLDKAFSSPQCIWRGLAAPQSNTWRYQSQRNIRISASRLISDFLPCCSVLAFLPGLLWTLDFWDSDVNNQAGVRLRALVAVAKPVCHVRLLLQEWGWGWGWKCSILPKWKDIGGQEGGRRSPFPKGPWLQEVCLHRCTRRSWTHFCTRPPWTKWSLLITSSQAPRYASWQGKRKADMLKRLQGQYLVQNYVIRWQSDWLIDKGYV